MFANEFEKVCVLGLGYVGLPTAAAIATQKISVLGVDVNAATVETINDGRIHIVEPELDVAVQAAVTRKFLRAATTPEQADAFLLAVPTPFNEGFEPDLSFIESATRSIAPLLEKGNLVILESTSPVGATEKVCEWLAEQRPDLTFPHQSGAESDIRVAHCPERVLPGKVMFEIAQNDRVIGGITPACGEAAKRLYQTFVRGECVVTTARTAELCKLTENAARDVNIAFANEMSLVCDRFGVDVWEMIDLANRHPRINILQPGPGVGGHCIAVDPWFIASQARDITPLIQCARGVNVNKPTWVIGKVEQAIKEFLEKNTGRTAADVKVACFGLAFKADIDDLRESPAMEIALNLADRLEGAVFAVEPNITTLPDACKDSKLTLESTEQALLIADIYVLLVDHRQFRGFNPSLAGRSVVDTRGIWKPT